MFVVLQKKNASVKNGEEMGKYEENEEIKKEESRT